MAAARELPQLSLVDALELTLLVARKDPRRHQRVGRAVAFPPIGHGRVLTRTRRPDMPHRLASHARRNLVAYAALVAALAAIGGVAYS